MVKEYVFTKKELLDFAASLSPYPLEDFRIQHDTLEIYMRDYAGVPKWTKYLQLRFT